VQIGKAFVTVIETAIALGRIQCHQAFTTVLLDVLVLRGKKDGFLNDSISTLVQLMTGVSVGG
jgi:hypothetical protein